MEISFENLYVDTGPSRVNDSPERASWCQRVGHYSFALFSPRKLETIRNFTKY